MAADPPRVDHPDERAHDRAGEQPIVSDGSFVPAYLRARVREQRLLSDDRVRVLPYLPRRDPRAGEWRLRADTARRMTRYLAGIDRPIDVWELGCGNGWLAARMAQLQHVTVTGFDVNGAELDQARRVFEGRPRLALRHGDIGRATELLGQCRPSPDVVVFASSLQYAVSYTHLTLPTILRV